MKNLLLTVQYTDGTLKNGKGSFWADSYIRNTEIKQNEGETIHASIKRAIEEIDSAELCYKGNPQSNIYRDLKTGESKIVGYVYKVKHYIADRGSNFQGYAYFDAWATIKQVDDLELESVEY